MRKAIGGVVIAAVTALASMPASADPAYGVFNFGFDFGGDELIEVTFSDGSTDSINAGDGFYLAAGIGKTFSDGQYSGQVTLGWKFTSISASNADVDWTRFPLEALVYMNREKIRVGGGLTYHMNTKLKGSGGLSFIDVDVGNGSALFLRPNTDLATPCWLVRALHSSTTPRMV